MRTQGFSDLSNQDLLERLDQVLARDRRTTAELLALIGEVGARKLYREAGCSSMRAYCVRVLRLSEDSALKRIQAARAAHRFPAILDAVAEGRIHLSGVCLLAPHLVQENVDELLRAAEMKSKAEIEQMLAERYPRTEVLTMVHPAPDQAGCGSGAMPSSQRGVDRVGESADEHAPGHALADPLPAQVAPLSAQSFELHVTIDRETHELLRYAQELSSHRNPNGDIAQVLRRALADHVRRLEKRKFGTTSEPRPGSRRSSSNPRSIPAHVRHAVWKRDEGRCTFVGDTGERCNSRRFVELDHIVPVARGGESTVGNLRVLCAEHNALEAERLFGAGYMEEKREEARRAAARSREAAAERARAAEEERVRALEAEEQARAAAAEEERVRHEAGEQTKDVICGLRNLGYRADQARRVAEQTASLASGTLEARLRAALAILCPKRRVVT